MFNLVYQELVQRVNEMNCGISIGDKHFNIFCYADDILLASTTITGLQVMIDVCKDYVEAHGLKFNASKTISTIKGKTHFTSEASLLLNGTTLTKENTKKYLGANLGNDGSATHVAQLIKAANGSYFKLQAAGMHGGALTPDAIRHIYTLAIQPTLTYGAHAIHLNTVLILFIYFNNVLLNANLINNNNWRTFFSSETAELFITLIIN